MQTSLGPLFEFLSRFGPDVEGRIAEPIPADIRDKLNRFARGLVPEDERRSLCDLLRSRPDWMRWVADLVKDERAQRAQ